MCICIGKNPVDGLTNYFGNKEIDLSVKPLDVIVSSIITGGNSVTFSSWVGANEFVVGNLFVGVTLPGTAGGAEIRLYGNTNQIWGYLFAPPEGAIQRDKFFNNPMAFFDEIQINTYADTTINFQFVGKKYKLKPL